MIYALRGTNKVQKLYNVPIYAAGFEGANIINQIKALEKKNPRPVIGRGGGFFFLM